MKKIFYLFIILVTLTGCGNMNNTPTKKVEELLNKYQMNDEDVLEDLDNVLMIDDLTDDERRDYRDFMKKHYQDMTYKIKEEKIDGQSATVDAEVTVRSYANAVNSANEYRIQNSSEFDQDNTFASYRLNKLKKVSDKQTYTITFHLTKTDGEWSIDPISLDDENKINGLYGVNDINDTTYNNQDMNTDNANTNQDMNTDNGNTEQEE